MSKQEKPWEWRLDNPGVTQSPSNGLTVMSTFSGGGGSSMGYRLAGFDLVSGAEIDLKMADIYEKNLGCSVIRGDIRALANGDVDLPIPSGELDVLDGSPPCSVFSTAGQRDKKWGTEHKFREGQVAQRLDDLFPAFIKLADRLQPRVIIAENVMGLIRGNAKGYVAELLKMLMKIGYETQIFVLDSSLMGVPQKRRRVFFVSRRNSAAKISMRFDGGIIPFSDIRGERDGERVRTLTVRREGFWRATRPGDTYQAAHPTGCSFTRKRVALNEPLPTITAHRDLDDALIPRMLTDSEHVRGQTFPLDYDFGSLDTNYVCGMSVPPFMARSVGRSVAKALGA